MRSFLTIVFLAFSVYASACSCATLPLLEKIAYADFVATAKIISVVPDKESAEYHNIEIELIDIFKGERTTKLRLHSDLNSSCSFLTSENSTWLIFAKKDNKGNLSFGYCSDPEQIDRKFDLEKYPNADKNHKRSLALKLDVLNYLKEKKIYPGNEQHLRVSFSREFLKEFNGTIVEHDRFSLYKLIINEDLSVKEVQLLKGFDNQKIKQNLGSYLKDNIKIYQTEKKSSIPEKAEIILCFYYYPPEKNDPSFISMWDL